MTQWRIVPVLHEIMAAKSVKMAQMKRKTAVAQLMLYLQANPQGLKKIKFEINSQQKTKKK